MINEKRPAESGRAPTTTATLFSDNTADHGPEVLPTSDVDAAHRLDSRIRLLAGNVADNLTKLTDLIAEAQAGQIHLTLGFKSWPAYLASALAKLKMALNTEARRELVDVLTNAGMSQRAIAQAVGVSQKTVDRDLDKVGQVSRRDSPTDNRCIGCNVNPARRGDCLCCACFNLEAQIHGTPLLPRSESPKPLTVTGLDGKTYTKPKPVKKSLSKVEVQRKMISRLHVGLVDAVREANSLNKGLDPGFSPGEAKREAESIIRSLDPILLYLGNLLSRADIENSTEQIAQ